MHCRSQRWPRQASGCSQETLAGSTGSGHWGRRTGQRSGLRLSLSLQRIFTLYMIIHIMVRRTYASKWEKRVFGCRNNIHRDVSLLGGQLQVRQMSCLWCCLDQLSMEDTRESRVLVSRRTIFIPEDGVCDQYGVLCSADHCLVPHGRAVDTKVQPVDKGSMDLPLRAITDAYAYIK